MRILIIITIIMIVIMMMILMTIVMMIVIMVEWREQVDNGNISHKPLSLSTSVWQDQ